MPFSEDSDCVAAPTQERNVLMRGYSRELQVQGGA
jgi:hypothetical protein